MPNLAKAQRHELREPHKEQDSVPRFDFVKSDQGLSPSTDHIPERSSEMADDIEGSGSRLSTVPSMAQSSMSVIDMYRDQDTDSCLSQESASDRDVSPQTERYDSVSSKIDMKPFFASANDLLTLRSSRNNVSKIRLSIEENETKLSSSRDRYGFRKRTNFVSEEQYNAWWMDYSKHCARRKKKWELLFNKNGLSLNNDSPVRFPARSEKLKRYVRKGIPAEWRGNAWWYFAKGPEKLKNNVGVYDTLIESTFHLHNKDTEIIERDLNRTFPDNIHFKPERSNPSEDPPETALVEALRRVLVAFSSYNPAIGYCQSLNFIAGLLLIFMDEEKAFWMLVIITSRYLPGVHDVNLEGVNIDQGVLMLTLREYLPDAWSSISVIDFEDPMISPKVNNNYDFLVKLPPITLCTSSWFMSAFIGTMPIETTLRVWDCLFYEESCVLFKTALAVFKLIEPKIVKIQDEMEIFQLIQNTPKTLIDPTPLFDLMFKRRLGLSNLTQDEVTRCKKYVTERRQRAHQANISGAHDADFNRKLLGETLWQPDLYGFKKGLPGVQWSNSLTRKMKSKIRRNR